MKEWQKALTRAAFALRRAGLEGYAKQVEGLGSPSLGALAMTEALSHVASAGVVVRQFHAESDAHEALNDAHQACTTAKAACAKAAAS